MYRAPEREVRIWTTDSRQWGHYKPRQDDIVIATFPKCGTTWMQQIVSLLVFRSAEPRALHEISPWIDRRLGLDAMLAMMETQTHRRFLKSHLPFDALPIYDEVKYIHIARQGLDAFMSWHNHTLHYTPTTQDKLDAVGRADETIGRPWPRPSADPREFFQVWMTEGPDARLADDYPAASYFDIERSWWAARPRPNVLMVHYNDLKSDLAGEMKRIAGFLDISVEGALWPTLIEAGGFDFMRRNGAALMPNAGLAWDKGSERFLNKGTNGRWHDVLTADDVARYEARVRREVSPALAAWLAKGRLVAGDPCLLPD
jgi:aryl sulfotransferase